MLFSQIVSAIF